MTMFTEGRLQAYERMMRQMPDSRGKDRDGQVKTVRHTGGARLLANVNTPKGGGRNGRHQS